MTRGSNLNRAKKNKNDEFYTRLVDIENELKHYKNHFKDKVVYCNCDDPRVSNFYKYFSLNFHHLGLKKLITTCYRNQDINLFSQEQSEKAVKLIYEGEVGDDNLPHEEHIKVTELQGDGDFRSLECINILKEADIIVTNPPFSLFRDYVSQLMNYNKKFLIIGNMNALTYKEIFPLIKNDELWLGYNSVKEFIQPDGTIKKFGNILWYTNLDHTKRHEEIILYRRYNESDYPKYDNYNAIEVSKVANIPEDYEGIMGVPITFLNKYNPEQFEVLGSQR